MKWKNNFLVLLLGLILIAPVWNVSAEPDESNKDDEKDEKDEDTKDEKEEKKKDDFKMKHKTKVEISDKEIKVELEQESGDTKSKVKFWMKTEQAHFRLKFEDKNTSEKVKQDLKVELRQLIEYIDGNGNGAYDKGENVIGAWNFGDEGSPIGVQSNGSVEWEAPTLSDVSSNNMSGKKMSSRGSFGFDGEATFGVDMYVFGDFTTLGSVSMKPTDVKIDFLIEDFNYSSNDSSLALLIKTKTKQKAERDHSTIKSDEEGLVASSTTDDGTSVGLSFTWKNNATVDGVEMPVHTTTFSGDAEQDDGEFEFKNDFALSYARGANILHDPTAGVDYNTQTTTSDGEVDDDDDKGVPGFTLAVAMISVVVAAAVFPSRRE